LIFSEQKTLGNRNPKRELTMRNGTIIIFQLTDKGLNVAKKVFDATPKDEKDRIIQIKTRFNSMPLSKLLAYVYRRYRREP